jgi:hypothetical protein
LSGSGTGANLQPAMLLIANDNRFDRSVAGEGGKYFNPIEDG